MTTPDTAPKPISVVKAGEMLGVSHTAVQNAIKAGRLVESVVNVRGKSKILAHLVRDEWLKNSDHRRMAEKNSGVLEEPAFELSGVAPKRIGGGGAVPHSLAWQIEQARKVERQESGEEEPEEKEAEETVTDKPLTDLNKLKREQEFYKLQVARADYEKRAGKLLDADKVQAQAFKIARVVRDSVMAIPDRLASQLAAETDTHKCYAMLVTEFTSALEALAVEHGA